MNSNHHGVQDKAPHTACSLDRGASRVSLASRDVVVSDDFVQFLLHDSV